MAAIESHPDIPLKGAANKYTSINGNMFTAMNKAGEVGFRMSKADQSMMMEKYGSGPFMSYGARMRDYVTIPDSVLEDERLLMEVLNRSYDFAQSLPVKPSKKKK